MIKLKLENMGMKLRNAVIIVLIISMIGPLSGCIGVVGAGEVGVNFNALGGGVQEKERQEGFYITWPWVSVIPYTIKTQEYTMSIAPGEGVKYEDDRIEAISKDSMTVGFDITVLYKLMPEKASEMHQEVGKEYAAILIRPMTRTVIRDVASEYNAMDMHKQRPEIAEKILNSLRQQLADKNIVLENVLVRSIIRPPQIEQAIQNKLEAEQEAQKMEFIIQKERKEKDRKIIEAEGIAGANKIISNSLTTSYLTWYWIENLDTHNSVIYVPVGNNGMPLFKEVSAEAQTSIEGTTSKT